MDTVKVDITRLQLLNDRINQTLEALSAVRASVHGLQHSAGVGGYGYGYQGYQGIGQQGIGQGFPGLAYGQTPFGIGAQATPLTGAFGMSQGLSHTTDALDVARWADPTWVIRCRQAFPNLTSPVAPLV